MGKASQYLFILVTVYGFLLLAGIINSGFVSVFILHPELIRTSGIWTAIYSALMLFGGISVITLGLIFPQKLDQGVSIGITLIIADIIFECSIGIFNALKQTSPALAMLLCAPIILVGALAAFEWWRTPMV
jgi:hypothetical protein